MIDLGHLPDTLRETWWTLFDLAELFPDGWTLIGAQMVALHAAEHGRVPPRSSRDADVLANARVLRSRPQHLVRALLERGFEPSVGADHIAHRFRRGNVSLDVLAPEGLDQASPAALLTVPPNHTIQVPGGTQALARTERVTVCTHGRAAAVPRPSLLGALVIKACAVDVSDHKADQRRDFGFLCGLVADPRTLRAEMTATDLRRLRARRELAARDAEAWRQLGPDGDDAYRAFRVLTRATSSTDE